MARVKGERLPGQSKVLLNYPSVAYLECGSFENANALKTWFDNKYVGFSGLRAKLTFRPVTSKIDVRQQL